MNGQEEWIKSSFSNGNGGSNCVEVRKVGGRYYVRDSKNREAGTLEFTQSEWDAFVAGVANGEFRF